MVDTHGVQPFNFSGFAFRISCRYALRCDLDVENPRVSEMIRCPGLCSPSAGISRRLSRPGVELAEPFSPVMADDTNSNSRTLWGRIHALHPRLEACHSSLRSQLLSVTGAPKSGDHTRQRPKRTHYGLVRRPGKRMREAIQGLYAGRFGLGVTGQRPWIRLAIPSTTPRPLTIASRARTLRL